MDEHWKQELTKLRDAPAPPEDLWHRVGRGPRLTDQRDPAGTRSLTFAIALAVAVAAIALVWIVLRPLHGDERTPGAVGLLSIPPLGQVEPANLDDGRPVFVVHRDDGTVEVIDAFSTHVPGGFQKLVAWCPSSHTFDDILHGSKWNQDGMYLLGPGPTGLVTYQTTVLKDGRVLVGPAIAGAPRSAPRTSRPTGPFCATGADTVFPTLPTAVSNSPTTLAEADPTGWVSVRGTLLARANGDWELCTFGARTPSECNDGVQVIIPPTPDDLRHGFVYSGTFITQVGHGAFVNLTAVPKPGIADSG